MEEINCVECRHQIRSRNLVAHLEECHVGEPCNAKNTLILRCPNCPFTSTLERIEFFLKHLIGTGHDSAETELDWIKFQEAESARIREMIRIGTKILRGDGPRNDDRVDGVTENSDIPAAEGIHVTSPDNTRDELIRDEDTKGSGDNPPMESLELIFVSNRNRLRSSEQPLELSKSDVPPRLHGKEEHRRSRERKNEGKVTSESFTELFASHITEQKRRRSEIPVDDSRPEKTTVENDTHGVSLLKAPRRSDSATRSPFIPIIPTEICRNNEMSPRSINEMDSFNLPSNRAIIKPDDSQDMEVSDDAPKSAEESRRLFAHIKKPQKSPGKNNFFGCVTNSNDDNVFNHPDLSKEKPTRDDETKKRSRFSNEKVTYDGRPTFNLADLAVPLPTEFPVTEDSSGSDTEESFPYRDPQFKQTNSNDGLLKEEQTSEIEDNAMEEYFSEDQNSSAHQIQRTKRERTKFTGEQLRVLQRNFRVNSNPDGQNMKRIAQVTGLSKRVIQIWFQNSRAKRKKYQSLKMKCSPNEQDKYLFEGKNSSAPLADDDRRHTCSICDKSIIVLGSSLTGAMEHARKHNSSLASYACLGCKYLSATLALMQSHLARKTIRCKGYRTLERDPVELAERRDTMKTIFPSVDWNHEIGQSTYLPQINKEFRPTEADCAICGRTVGPQKQKFLRHISKHLPESTKLFSCRSCPLRFWSPREYKIHRKNSEWGCDESSLAFEPPVTNFDFLRNKGREAFPEFDWKKILPIGCRCFGVFEHPRSRRKGRFSLSKKRP